MAIRHNGEDFQRKTYNGSTYWERTNPRPAPAIGGALATMTAYVPTREPDIPLSHHEGNLGRRFKKPRYCQEKRPFIAVSAESPLKTWVPRCMSMAVAYRAVDGYGVLRRGARIRSPPFSPIGPALGVK